MKLSTRSYILKSTNIEITTPRVLECADLESKFKKHGVTAEFPVFALPVLGVGPDDETACTPQDKWLNQYMDIIDQAKAEARKIVAEARKQAEEILAKAQEESEDLKKTVEEEVKKQIIPLARAEGLEKGLEEAKEQAHKIKSQAKNYLEIAKQVLTDEYNKADVELVKLCSKVAEKIIHATLSVEPSKLLSVIRSLTLMPMEKEGIKLHLSPEDAEWYKEISGEDKPSYPFIVDEGLKAGDVFLECSEGIFDARIDSQLDKLTQFLLEELDHGRLDGLREES